MHPNNMQCFCTLLGVDTEDNNITLNDDCGISYIVR